MSISYNVVPNALTNPPSFTTRVAPNLILDFDEMAAQINLHNPTIPVATAKSVLESFREEVKTQLLNGNTVKLTNFVSFVTTIPVNLANATDPLPPNSLDIKAKPAATFKVECNQGASYVRTGYPVKSPTIIATLDTNTGINDFIKAGRGFKINGTNIGFDATDALQGVWLRYGTGTEVKQTNISVNNPSEIVITPDYTLPEAGQSEIAVVVKSRYTTNGQIRTGELENKVRSHTGTSSILWRVTANGIAPASYSITSCTEAADYRFIATIRPDNVLTIAVGKVGGVVGSAVMVLAGGHVLVSCTEATFDVNVIIYHILYNNVLLYQRFMQEIAEIPVTP